MSKEAGETSTEAHETNAKAHRTDFVRLRSLAKKEESIRQGSTLMNAGPSNSSIGIDHNRG